MKNLLDTITSTESEEGEEINALSSKLVRTRPFQG